MPYLQTHQENVLEKPTFPLGTSPVRIGRLPECEIAVDRNDVSRIHARILFEDNQYFLEDLKSRNGTFLNGEKVIDKMPIREGDVLRFCDVEFTFCAEEADGSGARAVIVDDNPNEAEAFTIKSCIPRPVLTSANAAIKLQALIDIARNLGASVDEVLRQIVTNLLKIFLQADCAYIMMVDPQTKRLEVKAYQHRDPNNQDQFRISRTIVEKVAASKQAFVSDDVTNDSRFDVSESIVISKIYSFMVAPVMDYDKSEVLGVIQVDARSSGRRFTHEDLDLLVSLSFQIAVAYQNAQLQEVAIMERVLANEMSIANSVQRGFLPTASPQVRHYGFFDYYKPAKYLGGDYYDYIQLTDGRLVFALGDVSGKGVPAALLMAKLSAEVRTGLLLESSFAKAMCRLNNVYNNPGWDSRFITFFFGVLTPSTHEIEFYNAGHLPPILVSQNGNLELLGEERIGLPLGIMPDTEYSATHITIQNGQRLVVLSDGMTDAMNAQNQCFGSEGIYNHLRQANSRNITEFGKNLVSAVASFAGRTPQTDDQSLIILGRDDE